MTSAAPQIEIVTPAALPTIVDEWRRLWRAVPTASPFLAPAWLDAWAATYAPGRTWAAALREGGDLVGLLPAFVWARALLLAGTGPSDHGGLLILPGRECRTVALVAAAADAVEAPFDRIDFRQLPSCSPLAKVAMPGWRAATESDEACAVLALAGAAGMAAVPRPMRRAWRYATRRLAREGCVVDCVPPEEVSRGIAELERLHALRWQDKGRAGVLADPLLRGLLRAAAPRLAADGLIRLHRVRRGTETIAVLLVLVGNGRACYFLGGFDPQYARWSPGTALVGAAIAAAADEGAAAFDFLRGAEAYKYRWGAEDRRRVRRVLIRA